MKINEAVARMRPRRYTAGQVAPLVGRSVDTIKRWDRLGIYSPSHVENFGKLAVPLYDEDDLAKLQDIAATIKPGRQKRHGL